MKLAGLLIILFFFSTENDSFGQTYIFAQLTGTPMNTTGWTMRGDAHVGRLFPDFRKAEQAS